MTTPAATALASRSRGAALATLLALLFLTFLDTTVVSVALGSIQYRLGAGVIPLQWVVDAYSLVFASLMLVAGSLGDRFGRKKIMLAGGVVFCLGSVLCALAPNVATVIAGRAVMGAGAAASEPGTLSMLRQLYPEPRERARALGLWSAVSGLALAVGPVVGGVLVQFGDWRTIFWFNLVLGAVVLAAAARWVPESLDPDAAALDRGGFVTGTLALAAVIVAGISGEQYGYGTWWIVALFVVGALASAVFVPVELRARSPMLDVRLLRDRVVGGALFVAFAAYLAVFSIFFLTALYLDLVVGYSGARFAAVFAPMAGLVVLGSLAAGRWVAAAGTRWPMAAGCVVAAAGLVIARGVLTARPSFAGVLVALAVAGLGFGLAVVPLTAAVLGGVSARRSGMAAAATNTARQLGTVVGVAALGAIVNSYVANDFGADLARSGASRALSRTILGLIETGGSDAKGLDIAHPPAIFASVIDQATDALRAGLHTALLVSAVLLLLGAAVALLGRQPISTDGTSAGSAPPSTASSGSA